MGRWYPRRIPATAIASAGASRIGVPSAGRSCPRPSPGAACEAPAGHGRASRTVFLVLLLSLSSIPGVFAADVPVLILDFELNDLTLDPGSAQEQERVASLRPLLAETLAAKGGYRIVDTESERQARADRSFGYLFDHHDAAAELGRSAGADWVVVGRVHKASFLFVYFMAHLIDTKTDQLAGDFIVEVKGPQKRLTIRGVESLAEKIDATLRGQALAGEPAS
jgi:hypothetical protein